MADLIAQGLSSDQRWRRSLPIGESISLGRASGVWSAPWDERISRRHAVLVPRGDNVEVTVVPEAKNPVFHRGRKVDRFTLEPGEHFVIGATTFTLVVDAAAVSLAAPVPHAEHTFVAHELRRAAFRDPESRIAAIARLPEVISGGASDEESFVRFITLLMSGIAQAKAAALIRLGASGEIEVLHWDRRMIAGGDFHPSERLIRQAISAGESVVHWWEASQGDDVREFTLSQGVDWAFCTPMKQTACRDWALYVTGTYGTDQSNSTEWLRDEVKFTELAASTFATLREAQLIVRRTAGLRQFFSPLVLEAIGAGDPELVLAPREAEVTVLFCDLRGFSRVSEAGAGDLLGLLTRAGRALGVMTRHILGFGGVIGDFHGDAAMGFWGWPLAQHDAPLRACRAALAIRREFEAAAASGGEHPLAEFRAGIGIASGKAVAGKIGTSDQVKVTVFGPVANLASRLEGMTKQLSAPILLDEATAAAVRESLPSEEGRLRRVARVRPAGLNTPLMASELLPPSDDAAALNSEQIADYETALDALHAGDWQRAWTMLHRVPAEDRVKDFLTLFMARHNRTPPPQWDGVISLAEK